MKRFVYTRMKNRNESILNISIDVYQSKKKSATKLFHFPVVQSETRGTVKEYIISYLVEENYLDRKYLGWPASKLLEEGVCSILELGEE